MTTTMSPANRQAFLQALRDDQGFREEARALLLTQELLKLPEKLAALTERVDQFIMAQEAINAEQREFNAAQREFNAEQREFNRTAEIRLSRLEDQVAALTTQVANLTTQVSNLTTQVSNLTGRVDNLTTQVGNLTGRIDNLTTQVGDLQGNALEARVERRIHSLIYRRLEFRGAQILMSRSNPPNQSLHNFLQDAVDQNRITTTDVGQLLSADLLLRARLPDSTEQVHVAVEVSRTVGNDDITRARERADLLAAAAGTQGRAVVIGSIIPEPQRERAAALGVALFQEGD